MMLLEHDAKQLLAARGIPVPWGMLVDGAQALPDELPGSAWVVKAQVGVGGRGKAGGIRSAGSADEIRAHLRRLIGTVLKGHRVDSCRVEVCIDSAREAYASFSVDAVHGRIAVLLSGQGGVDIESDSGRAHLVAGSAEPDREAVAACIDALAADLPPSTRATIRAAAHALATVFFDLEATLLEINPLFIQTDGRWLAGDAKFIVDEDTLARQPALDALLRERAVAYPQAALKRTAGFDYVELDRDGDIGLITTGAGLTMQLIDELVAHGAHPFNFCDIRTAQFRGEPARLIQVMRWIADGPNVRAVMVNFFAGMTDLGEIAGLLVAALAEVKALRVPVTARLIGNGLDKAIGTVAAAGQPFEIETDLDVAIAKVIADSRREAAHA